MSDRVCEACGNHDVEEDGLCIVCLSKRDEEDDDPGFGRLPA